MSEILAIASGTWKGILRMKVVYFLILCVFILVASAQNYDVISLNQHRPLMLDVMLTLNKIAAILVVVSITFEIPRELREGVASTLLTKSLGRTQYIVGKLVGVIVTALVICAIIAVGSCMIYKFSFNEILSLQLLQTELLVIASVIPMAAIGVFFAIILPDMLAPILTVLGIWFAYSTQHLAIPVLSGGILPNLDFFNLNSHAVYQTPIPWCYIGLATLWGIAFAVFATALACTVFRFRDIK